MSGTMKYALVRKARDNSGATNATDQNCTCGGTFFTKGKEFSNFLKLKVKFTI